MPIEKVLYWAYVDELPRGYHLERGEALAPHQSMSPMFKYAAHGGPVDNWSREPGYPAALGLEPHPDALAVHAAVMELEEWVSISWPAGAPVILGDLARYVHPDELDDIKSTQASPRGLTHHHALMSKRDKPSRPTWRIEYEVQKVAGRERKSLLRKGRGRRSRRLMGEWKLEPGSDVLVGARFDYLTWRCALDRLATNLVGKLRSIEPLRPEAPLMPWYQGDQEPFVIETGPQMTARHLASGRASILARLPLKPPRPRALPPEPAPTWPGRRVK